MVKKTTVLGVSLVAALTTAALVPSVYAEPPAGVSGQGERPEAPSAQNTTPGDPVGSMNGNSMNTTVAHSGVMTIESDLATDGQTYESVNDTENAILMTAGTVTLTNPAIKKTGAADGDNADFYGTNAAVFVSGGTLNITGGTVTTDGAHANAIFAYGDGLINISNTNIKTTNNNSGALMVTGGGKLNATYVTATTDGNSSAPIRSDRGGGTMVIDGGSYTSNGTGSPVIYSTADITAKNTKLTSTASEGVVIEGKNSVTLDNVELTADNNKLNGQSETYKTIFIYQSMSGDADEGVGSFTAKNSKITTKNGDTFFVTNTTAEIKLENNIFTNESGDFLRIQAVKWGNSGANGGVVTLSASAQEIVGDIVVDNISSLDFKLENDSFLKAAINADNTAKAVNVELSADSVIVLTKDSYITTLVNADADNKNIYGNGHKLYVNGVEVQTNTATPPTGRKNPTKLSETETKQEEVQQETETVDDYSTLGFILASAGSFLVLVVGGILIARSARSSKKDTGKDDSSDIEVPLTDKTTKAKSAAEVHHRGQGEGPHAR